MNPIEVKKSIEIRLRNYARQSIPIEKAHPEATSKLLQFFSNPETALLRDPYLELLPRYKAGETLAELRDAGLIDEITAEIFAEYFGKKKPSGKGNSSFPSSRRDPASVRPRPKRRQWVQRGRESRGVLRNRLRKNRVLSNTGHRPSREGVEERNRGQ